MIRAETPGVGKVLAKVGAFILALTASVEVLEGQIVISVPQEWQLLVDSGKMILAGVGTFILGAGVTATKQNPDNL